MTNSMPTNVSTMITCLPHQSLMTNSLKESLGLNEGWWMKLLPISPVKMNLGLCAVMPLVCFPILLLLSFWRHKKIICYGMSISAFKDYFQMGESTGNQCLSKLCTGIMQSPKYSDLYLCFPNKIDTRKIVDLYEEVHGIDSMLGSLDVTKIYWSSCPTAWKGQ